MSTKKSTNETKEVKETVIQFPKKEKIANKEEKKKLVIIKKDVPIRKNTNTVDPIIRKAKVGEVFEIDAVIGFVTKFYKLSNGYFICSFDRGFEII